jgi:predicted metal-dependent phosphoesterase TrpH
MYIVSFRVDPHVKILDQQVVDRAKRRGLDALVYAPHFTHLNDIIDRAEQFSNDDLLVVPAREIFTGSWRKRRHVLAVGLSKPVPDFITLEAAMAELNRQDCVTLVPHPEFATVSFGAKELEMYKNQLDGIEVYNPKHRGKHNGRARKLAEETQLPPFASSYAHLRLTVGEVWTEFEDSFNTPEELVEGLRSHLPRRLFHRPGQTHRLRCHTEFAHLGWENSWEKFERLVLKGQEATHPKNPSYEGRFDDASVY